MHFETYRWEDHVPRKGGWKFNLIAGALALGLITAAFPEGRHATPAIARAAAEPALEAGLREFDVPRTAIPTAVAGAADDLTPCPIAGANS